MTLYYSLVFTVLLFEMAIFCLLILPLPFTWRKSLFRFISESPIVAKLQYGLKITFIFILVLFIDSVNRVFKVSEDAAAARPSNGGAAVGAEAYRSDMQARKFYSQRNMYLCGFTLFLSLILNRTYALITDILKMEETLARLQNSTEPTLVPTSSADDAAKATALNKEQEERILELEAKVESKERELEVVKKQAKQNLDRYDELSEEYKKGNLADKKSD
ncbi:Endoplasmic reticulum transmembrane protein 3 [Saitoella coloradoensis]